MGNYILTHLLTRVNFFFAVSNVWVMCIASKMCQCFLKLYCNLFINSRETSTRNHAIQICPEFLGRIRIPCVETQVHCLMSALILTWPIYFRFSAMIHFMCPNTEALRCKFSSSLSSTRLLVHVVGKLPLYRSLETDFPSLL